MGGRAEDSNPSARRSKRASLACIVVMNRRTGDKKGHGDEPAALRVRSSC